MSKRMQHAVYPYAVVQRFRMRDAVLTGLRYGCHVTCLTATVLMIAATFFACFSVSVRVSLSISESLKISTRRQQHAIQLVVVSSLTLSILDQSICSP
jgi:hypothetical protein